MKKCLLASRCLSNRFQPFNACGCQREASGKREAPAITREALETTRVAVAMPGAALATQEKAQAAEMLVEAPAMEATA